MLPSALLASLLTAGCADDRPAPPAPPAGVDSVPAGETGDSPTGGSDSDSEPPDAAGFTLGAPAPCAAPADAVAYVESGEAWGLTPDPLPDADHLNGGAVAVHDFDGDGDLDIAMVWARSDLLLFARDGDGFTPSVVASDIQGALMGLGDADGNGWVDLLYGGPTPVIFFNDGESLQLGTALASVERGHVQQLAPADLDGDGDLDLYAATSAPEDEESRTDFLLWNDGAGSFTEDRASLPTAELDGLRGQAFLAMVFDWEVDGDPDIYVDNDMGGQVGPNVMLRNDDGALVDAAADCACGLAHSGMGADAGDYNRDGWPDLYLSATGQTVLLAGQADGTFIDVTVSASADPIAEDHEMTWGAAWLDFDNDGQQDVLAAQGDLWAADHAGSVFEAPINLLRQDAGVFEDVGPDLGLATTGSWRAVSAADHNGDGVLDLLVTEVVGRPHLYLSQGCTANGWLVVDAPLGSRVEVTAGGVTQVDWIHPTSGFGAAGPLEAWFGLGDAQTVDSLRVELPWGAGVYEEADFEARRRVTLTP